MGQSHRIQDRGRFQPGHGPLGYWLEQGRGPDPDESLSTKRAAASGLPGGWWLLPVLVMALPVWGVVIWLVVRG